MPRVQMPIEADDIDFISRTILIKTITEFFKFSKLGEDFSLYEETEGGHTAIDNSINISNDGRFKTGYRTKVLFSPTQKPSVDHLAFGTNTGSPDALPLISDPSIGVFMFRSFVSYTQDLSLRVYFRSKSEALAWKNTQLITSKSRAIDNLIFDCEYNYKIPTNISYFLSHAFQLMDNGTSIVDYFNDVIHAEPFYRHDASGEKKIRVISERQSNVHILINNADAFQTDDKTEDRYEVNVNLSVTYQIPLMLFEFPLVVHSKMIHDVFYTNWCKKDRYEYTKSDHINFAVPEQRNSFDFSGTMRVLDGDTMSPSKLPSYEPIFSSPFIIDENSPDIFLHLSSLEQFFSASVINTIRRDKDAVLTANTSTFRLLAVCLDDDRKFLSLYYDPITETFRFTDPIDKSMRIYIFFYYLRNLTVLTNEKSESLRSNADHAIEALSVVYPDLEKSDLRLYGDAISPGFWHHMKLSTSTSSKFTRRYARRLVSGYGGKTVCNAKVMAGDYR